MDGCPTLPEIEGLLAGTLSSRDTGRIESHLARCADCAARRDELRSAAEALFVELRDAHPSDTGAGEAQEEHSAPPRLNAPAPVLGGPAADADDLPPAAASTGHRAGRAGRVPPGTSPHRPALGDAIPGYELLEEIHRGGQGVVYKAVQQATRRVVALKVLLHGRFATPRQRQRFEREIDLAASLDHPHIVTVFDSGTTPDGRDFYAMAYIDGASLDRHVAEAGLGVAGTLRLIHKVCRSVHFAHQRGVIHRDLKPDNIRVDSAGEPHVLDFGLARPVAPALTAEAMTLAGEFTGTLAYASPEQTLGEPLGVDIRTDVYSLGVLLYRVLTGQFPYRVTGAISQVLHEICNTIPQRPSLHNPQIDDEVGTIVLKALAKDRERRYQSADALARDLEHYLAGEPIDAKRDSTWYVLRKTVQRYRWPLATATIVALALAAALGFSLHYGRIATEQRDRAREAESLARAEAEKAQRRFNDLRQLAHAFIFDFHDRIASLPGATRAREFLISTALDYLDRLSREAGSSEDLRSDLASAYERIGDVQGNPHMSNVGDVRGAMASYEKSLTLTESLAREQPDNRHWQRRLAMIHGNIGGIYGSLRQPERALASYRRSVEFSTALVAADSGDAEILHNLSTAYDRMASTLAAMGRPEEAADCYVRALELAEDLADSHPDSVRYQLGPAICYSGLGDLHHNAGRLDEALAYFQRSLAISRGLAEAHPRHIEVLRGLAVCEQRIGNTLRALGRLDEALASHRNSLARSTALVGADIADAHARLSVAIDQRDVGDVLAAMGRGSDALSEYRATLATLEEVVAADHNYSVARHHLAITHSRIALTLQNAGDVAGALPHCQASVEIAAALASADPSDVWLQEDVVRGYGMLGHQQSILGQTHAALASYGRALSVVEATAAKSAATPATRGYQLQLHYSIAGCHATLGADSGQEVSIRLASWESARAAYRSAQAVLQDMVASGQLKAAPAEETASLTDGLEQCDRAVAELRAQMPE